MSAGTSEKNWFRFSSLVMFVRTGRHGGFMKEQQGTGSSIFIIHSENCIGDIMEANWGGISGWLWLWHPCSEGPQWDESDVRGRGWTAVLERWLEWRSFVVMRQATLVFSTNVIFQTLGSAPEHGHCILETLDSSYCYNAIINHLSWMTWLVCNIKIWLNAKCGIICWKCALLSFVCGTSHDSGARVRVWLLLSRCLWWSEGGYPDLIGCEFFFGELDCKMSLVCYCLTSFL